MAGKVPDWVRAEGFTTTENTTGLIKHGTHGRSGWALYNGMIDEVCVCGGSSERLRIPPPVFKISHLKLQRLLVCDSHHTMSDSIK